MIQEISIKIKSGGLTHTISIDTDIDGNLPYDLADAFIEVIRMTNANPDMVVEQLINEYGLPESVNNNSSYEADKVKIVWHDVAEEPEADKWILIRKNDYYKYVEPTMSWDDIKSNYDFSEWAYANDLAKQEKGGMNMGAEWEYLKNDGERERA